MVVQNHLYRGGTRGFYYEKATYQLIGCFLIVEPSGAPSLQVILNHHLPLLRIRIPTVGMSALQVRTVCGALHLGQKVEATPKSGFSSETDLGPHSAELDVV